MKNIILIASLLLPLHAFAANQIVKSKIAFTAVGKPAFIKANGVVPLKESKLTIKDNKLSGMVVVDISKLDSGIELRDTHLKDKYLHTAKFPIATLTIKDQAISASSSSHKITGELTFHNVTKPISFDANVSLENNVVKLKSDLSFLLTDFNVELPSFQGITAADKVKLNVETEIKI